MRKKRLMINVYPKDYQYIKGYVENSKDDTNICETVREIIRDGVEFMEQQHEKQQR